MLYVDLRGHVNCQVSTSLGLRTQDIFSKELCQKLLGIIKHENGADSLQSPPDGMLRLSVSLLTGLIY